MARTNSFGEADPYLNRGVAQSFRELFPWSLDPIRRESGGTVDLLMDGPIRVCSVSAALAMACRLLSCSLTTLTDALPNTIRMLCIFRFEAELKKQSPFFSITSAPSKARP